MDYNTMLEIATNRRSVRKFKDTPVSREDIEKIVQVGMQAPSGANFQPWDIVVVDDLKLRDQISDLLLEGIGDGKTVKGFVKAPVFVLLYGDTRVRPYGPAHKIANDKWWDFTFKASLNNAFLSMQFAVTSLGLGSMWVSAFRNPKVAEPVQKLLNIPEHLQVYEMLALGYSDIKIAKKKMRDISEVLHYNIADNYRNQEKMDEWFRPKRG